MRTVERALELLQQAEKKIRGLVSEAASVGDYSSVLTLAAWARAVNELTDSGAGAEPKLNSNKPTPKLKKAASAEVHNVSPHQKNQNGYPRFLRQSDQLIRIAWSKREKKEYRHKVPHSVLKLLTSAMIDKGKDGRVFSTDEFLPIHGENHDEQVPNYQAYVVISLLKQTGLIDQHGRQGYSIPGILEFKNAVEAIWNKLPRE